jgi:hypothetical protein
LTIAGNRKSESTSFQQGITQTIASSRPGLNPHTLTVRLRLRGLVRLMLARDSA